MLSFLKANIWTIVVLVLLVFAVVMIIRSLVKNKKEGKSACGCNCSECHGCCTPKK